MNNHANSYASLQEELLHVLSTRGLGYRDVFLPDTFGDSKEPADLCWVVDDLTILFYCKKSTKTQDNLDLRNVSQGRTWMRLWTDQLRLIGSNHVQKFDVPKSDVSSILIISVVETARQECRFLPIKKMYHDSGVVAAVSIPFEVLKALFDFGGNSLDIVNLCNMIVQNETVSTDQAVAWVQDIYRQSYNEARSLLPFNDEVDNSNYTQFSSGVISRIKVHYEQSSESSSAFGIMGLAEQAWLAGVLDLGYLTAGQVYPGMTSEHAFLLNRHAFGSFNLVVAVAAGPGILLENIDNIFKLGERGETIIGAVNFIGERNENWVPMIMAKPFRISKSVHAALNDLRDEMKLKVAL